MFRQLDRDFSSDERIIKQQAAANRFLPLDREFSPGYESSELLSDSESSKASHVSGNSDSSMIKRDMSFHSRALYF